MAKGITPGASMLPHGSAECHGHGALGVFDYACAVLLAGLMIYAKFARKELRVEWHDEHDVDESALKKAIEDAGFEFGGRV